MTKARTYKRVKQEGDPKGTSYTPGSARECERMNLHSQGNSHLGSWSPKGLVNLYRAIVGVKTHWFEEFFISLESH
jgi:hypothetical protein